MPEWDEARSLEQLREALAEWNEYLIRRGRAPIRVEDVVAAVLRCRQRSILRLIKGGKGDPHG